MKYKDCFNTDHVPIWYKSVGKYTWGIKYSGRLNVKTGCREKDRFTAQLGITKSGNKLIPFLVFKGDNTTYSSIFVLF